MFKLKQTIQDHTQAHYSNIIYLYTFTLQYKVILKYTDLVFPATSACDVLALKMVERVPQSN